MIDDRPDISLLTQWLEELIDWKPFGHFLPGITYSDILKIEADNTTIDGKKLALYAKWLHIASKATWADVINALSKTRENNFAQYIRNNLQKSAPRSASSYVAVTTRQSSQAEVKFYTAEDEKEILLTLINLKKEFSSLIMHARLGLEKKIKNDSNILHALNIWLETYMHLNDKLTNASLDETFKIIHPFYDFIDCSLIVDMSEIFLRDFKFGDNDLSIVSELKNYMEKANKLRCSAQVKHLNESLKKLYEEHIPDLSNMPMILVKLHNPWHGSNINGLSLLIHNLLPVGYQQIIMKYITISSGSVIIKYSGQVDPNVPMNDGANALMLACQKGHTRIVELLLNKQVGPKQVDPNVQNRKGHTALLFASTQGHYEIVKLLLESKADPNIKSIKGKTALLVAKTDKIKELLHNYSASETASSGYQTLDTL
ncbi:PREDICTED: uncharacterized protein LOC105314419 [Amphimedon queenslandica]|uniref:Death domain-containing protein n=1 Tax=Amphimedon queenslandica TaxID=400682 RepID=A0AAN0IQS3_AMPQE|nr:PREDICTED: uncharacterized protein LOC105314419 [Amphimedon queenslandica]|eukprot:XP_011406888.1 PREDICTED: uncharacterized protein LOC105314419 [Amphimedon queenslandica]